MVNEVSIPLDTMRQAVLVAAKEYTGREARINGQVKLEISLTPTLRVDEIQFLNAPRWQNEDFLSIGEARLQVELLPLLRGQLEILDVMVNDVSINLEQNSKGDKNWIFPISASASTGDPDQEHADKVRIKDDFTVSHLSLSNVTINYRDQELDKRYSATVDELHINTVDRIKLDTSITGKIGNTPYSLTGTSDLLRRLLNDEPWTLETQGKMGGHPFKLKAMLETADGDLGGEIDLHAEEVDIGQILEKLQITRGLEFYAGGLELKTRIEGSTLQQLVDRSSFDIAFTEGRGTLRSHVDERYNQISFRSVEVKAHKDQKLSANFIGKIGKEPVEFMLSTNPVGQFVRGIDEVTLTLAAKLAESEFEIKGNIELPISSRTLSVELNVAGERLDQWNSIMINDLPPYGPYKLKGKLKLTPKGVKIRDLQSVIGSSDLGGSIDIDMTGARPLWNMNLVSEQFRLDDFNVEGYSLIPGKEQDSDKNNETAASPNKDTFLKQADERIDEIREINEWDLDITLDARKVVSDQDHIGNGRIVLSARQDRFDESFQINMPAGKLQGEFGFRRANPGVSGYFKIDMDKFDYGIFLRHLDPDAEADGFISANVDLQLAGKDYSDSLARADGKIDMAIWPRNINADVMDIWAINLFFAVLPKLSTEESKVNCVVSVLNIEDGQLNEEFFAVDSTKVWLNGNLDINFPNETVRLSLFPRAKKARIFGLELPVILKGDFDEQNLVVNKSTIVGSVVSFILSPLHAPMRRIFGKHVPSDASEKCGQLMDRDYLHALQKKNEEYKKSRSTQFH
jgi:uncharacterized protein involved in outer membrane biogenesis